MTPEPSLLAHQDHLSVLKNDVPLVIAKMIGVAVSGVDQMREMPEIKTLADQGVPGQDFFSIRIQPGQDLSV